MLVCEWQVLREAQTRMQQAPPPPGSSSPQKESGLGTTGSATRKEFEVSPLLASHHHKSVVHHTKCVRVLSSAGAMFFIGVTSYCYPAGNPHDWTVQASLAVACARYLQWVRMTTLAP